MLTFFVQFIPGIIIALFTQSMTALFSPDHRRGGPIKWGLASYTLVIFSVVTIQTAMDLHLQSIAFVDNRRFPGVRGEVFPGPVGYQTFISHEAISIVPNVMFTLSNWIGDGLLVSFLIRYCIRSSEYLMPVPPALSLLCCLLHEHLGHHLPLPHVPRLAG